MDARCTRQSRRTRSQVKPEQVRASAKSRSKTAGFTADEFDEKRDSQPDQPARVYPKLRR